MDSVLSVFQPNTDTKMDYFDKAETWDRATLETVQLARLKTTTFSKPAARLSTPSALPKPAALPISALP